MGEVESEQEDESIAIERSGSASPLSYVPNLLLGALEDLRTIAASVVVLPELARTLGSIEG